jgi:hypothetical protein
MMVLGALILSVTSGSSDVPPRDAKRLARVVEYARSLKASTVEPTLPSIRLDEWLARAVGETALRWFVSDCDLKSNSSEPPEKQLLCVGAATEDQSGIELRFHLAVGDGARGISGKPHVLPQSFVACNPMLLSTIDILRPLAPLPALPQVARELRAQCVTAR